MRLTVVGCGSAYTAQPGRASSSYLVEHDGTRVLFDMGQGTFSELWRHTTPAEVTAVVVSHMHGDHNVDLIPLRHWVKYTNEGRGPRLYGPPEMRDRFGYFQDNPQFLADLAGDALEPGAFEVGPLRIEIGRVTHIPNSFAFRVTAPGVERGLVYSGDCGVAMDLLPLIKPTDVVLCEAAFGTDPADVPIHLSARDAAQVAAQGGASRLILTHILDRYASADLVGAAEELFDNEIEVASPGLTLDIS
jgi:ribonuclease BN (tRNA processing enzyme)